MYTLHKIYKNSDSSSKCIFKNVFNLKRSICIKVQWKSHGSFSTAPLTDVSQLMKRLIEGIALTPVINMHVLIQLLTRIDWKKKSIFPEGSLKKRPWLWIRVVLMERLWVLCWLHVQQRAHADSARVSNSRAEINAKKWKLFLLKKLRERKDAPQCWEPGSDLPVWTQSKERAFVINSKKADVPICPGDQERWITDPHLCRLSLGIDSILFFSPPDV